MKYFLIYLLLGWGSINIAIAQEKQLAVEYKVLDYFLQKIIPDTKFSKSKFYLEKKVLVSTSFYILYLAYSKDKYMKQYIKTRQEDYECNYKIKKKYKGIKRYKNQYRDFNIKSKHSDLYLISISKALYYENNYYCTIIISPNKKTNSNEEPTCYLIVFDDNLKLIEYVKVLQDLKQ